jgi:Zn-dependent protease
MGGTIRLFKFSGIQVYLHFSWFIYAAYEFTQRAALYQKPIWAAFEYIALFGIVLLHEFGHALACRQTGGTADQIVLWPLGGIAFVNPPRRPSAMLWSIAAGPLVNVILLPGPPHI